MRKWGLYWEKDVAQWVIRAGNKRYPRREYRHIEHDEAELTEFVHRLNAGIRTKKAVEIRHAFISPELISEFEEEVLTQAKNSSWAKVELRRLQEHFLNFFIGELNLQDPMEWYRVHRTKWTQYLRSERVPSSVTSKRSIVQISNKFMKWLHFRRPSEVPPLKFEPISKNEYKDIHGDREVAGQVRVRRFIPLQDWRKIRRALPSEIAPFAYLGYYYGLRRNETLGVRPGDVMLDVLNCDRQYMGKGKFKLPKGKKKRTIDHWFMRAQITKKWVAQADATRIPPDSLTARWNKCMEALGLTYDFHDLRHTFISLAAAKHGQEPVHIMHAAGHTQLATTMRYIHETRLRSRKAA